MIEILMCTYNGEKYIEKQLDSIRLQTRQADKLSIYDDISTDNTVAVINDYIKKYNLTDKWSVTINSQNKGWRKNFFDAIFASCGDIIFFSDQDDIWELDKIEVMSSVMEANENILKLNSKFTFIDQNDDFIKTDKEITTPTKELVQEPFLDTFSVKWSNRLACATAISKKLIDMLKGLPYNSSFSHDWFFENIATALDASFLIDYYSIKHRLHNSNASIDVSHNALFTADYANYIWLVFNDYFENVNENYMAQAKRFLKFATIKKKVNTKFALISWFKLAFYPKYYKRYARGLFLDLLATLHLYDLIKNLRDKMVK